MYRQRKGNILVLDPQEELERLDTPGALFVLVEHACRSMFYEGILSLGNALVGRDFAGIIFYGHTIAILFRILYTLSCL